MPIVIDASIAAAWILPDEHTDDADRLLDSLRREPGLVPSLFWFEMRSLFLVAERRGRLAPGEALLSMLQLRSLPLRDEGFGDDALVLTLAARHLISAYDAAYLGLAVSGQNRLATADQKLLRAARAEGVAFSLAAG